MKYLQSYFLCVRYWLIQKTLTDTLIIIPSSFIGRFSHMLISRCMTGNPRKWTCLRRLWAPFFRITCGFRNNFSSHRRLSECRYQLFEEDLERMFENKGGKESRNCIFTFSAKRRSKCLNPYKLSHRFDLISKTLKKLVPYSIHYRDTHPSSPDPHRYVQSSGSMTFWYGYGSSDPCHWLTDPDLFVSDLQDTNKNIFFLSLYAYFL